MKRLLRTYLAFLRAYFALTLTYRAMLVIWILSGVLPLIMMVVWIRVAEQQPAGEVGGFDRLGFISYYLAVIVVRRLTGAWIIWELDEDIRMGALSARLLRPIDPVHHYFSSPLAEKPVEFALVFPPVALAALWLGAQFDLSAANLLRLLPALAGAYCIEFFIQISIGMLAFWVTHVLTLVQVWFYVRAFLSGWIVPLALFPDVVQTWLHFLPFRYILSFPVEILLGQLSSGEILQGFAIQWLWVAVFLAVYRLLWTRGLRHYSAVGA